MSQENYKRKIDSGDDTKEEQLAEFKFEDGEVLPFKKSCSRLEKLLLCLVVVLTILTVVFIALYVTERKTVKSTANQGGAGSTGGGTKRNFTCNTTSPNAKSDAKICLSANCVNVASGMFTALVFLI